MTKKQRKSSRAVMARRSGSEQKQQPNPFIPGVKVDPNRAKKRHDQAWHRGETGRQRRLDAKQARRHRLQKARQGIKAIRHELRKRLRLEVRRHMRARVR